MNDTLTLAETASLLELSLVWTRQLVRNGTLKSRMVRKRGRLIYAVDKASAEAYRNRKEVTV
jgi:hypothetical protein